MLKYFRIFLLIFIFQNTAFPLEINDYVDDWLLLKESSGIKNIYPDFYKFKSLKWQKQGLEPSSELEKQFNSFKNIKESFIKKYVTLKPVISSALTSFEKVFPDLNKDNEIVLLHSLGELNGGIRNVNKKPIFLLGLDIMAKYHKWENDIPFFHHEFFHLYHKQKVGDQFSRGLIGDELWKEGIASLC